MNLSKYKKLREKIKNKDFEGKNGQLDKILYISSWIGNIGSIFFAYFLLFPALFKAISTNLFDGNIATYLAGFLTVLTLCMFELWKRKILTNTSFDLIVHKYKVTKKFFGLLLSGLALISASFYFSLNGAINFATTSEGKNDVIEQTSVNETDSLTQLYITYKQPFVDDNASLRKANVDLREKILSTPNNFRTVRNDMQKLVDANIVVIGLNDVKISGLNDELQAKILALSDASAKTKEENENKDFEGILLFLILSTCIELIIIVGVFFREYYEYNSYLINESDLEDTMITRDRYNTLVKFLFKEGAVGVREPIMGVSKLKEIVSKRSNIPSSNKLVDTFISDITYMNIVQLEGKRRYTACTYEEAIKKIEKFDDTLRLLEKLK
jgi:hypothetical protein